MKVISELEDVPDIQAICLALAELSIARPGWTQYLGEVASNFQGGEELYHAFRRNHALPVAEALGADRELEQHVSPYAAPLRHSTVPRRKP
jgi:hypothetical protein